MPSSSLPKQFMPGAAGWLCSDGLCADVCIVPVLKDNYSYLLVDRETKEAACIDPAEPDKVLQAVSAGKYTLKLSFTTHKHLDHSGGNLALISRMGQRFESLGPQDGLCPGITRIVRDGDEIHLGSLIVKVFHTPCHTVGSLMYYVTSSKKPEATPLLFSGDTLFVAGCGRFFEGTGKEILYAINKVVRSLPDSTYLFCGHEYTVKNLKFAQHVEPKNTAVAEKLKWAEKQQAEGLPSVPSTIGEEKLYNPFMRTEEAEVINAVQQSVGQPLTEQHLLVTELRHMKDRF